MILVLATPRGRANGLLFGVGWLAGGALGLGALVSAVNPKNAALTIAAAATIAGAGLPGGEQAVVLAVFVLIGSVGVLARWSSTWSPGRARPGPSTAGGHGPRSTTRP
jgi:hypothetical protein